MNILGQIWDTIVVNPLVNSLAFLYDLLWDNMGLSILVLTIVIRLLLLPLTQRQQRQTKKLQAIQPKIKALQKRYNTGRPEDKRKLSNETLKAYREAGISPIGCLGPLIIQLPIWIGLYRAIIVAIPLTPDGIVTLSRALYSWNIAGNDIPFNPFFLGVDLSANVGSAPLFVGVAVAGVVGASLWLQQKIASPTTADAQQRTTNRLLLWMLPVLFAFLSWQFPAGLAIYIIFSTLVGVVLHWFLGGREPLWGPKGVLFRTGSGGATAAAGSASQDNETEDEGGSSYETYVGVHRKNSRRGNRNSAKGTVRKHRRR